jgi:diguanylate cyclase (GGDEF)-like protein
MRLVPLRLRVAPKFFVVLAVLLPAIAALAWIGLRGLADLKADVDRLYEDNIVPSPLTSRVAADLHRSAELTLELLVTSDRARARELEQSLGASVMPRLQAEIGEMRKAHAPDPAYERALVERIAHDWDAFQTLHANNRLAAPGLVRGAERRGDLLARRVEQIFGNASAQVDAMVVLESSQAKDAVGRAARTYSASRALMLETAAAIMLAVAGVVMLLIRSVVPRVRAYSGFAARVAGGQLDQRLRPHGHDELSDLGTTLNELVDRRRAERDYEEAQAELTLGLQVTESEEEAHGLLKRHLERSIAGSSVVVLNRNNSADRLSATTALSPDSSLGAALADAKPGSCMAVRLGTRHEREPDRERLLECELCGQMAERSTCEPLLVGGEVIGSVLVEHAEELSRTASSQVKSSVAQAAPVLANLRNLAIAEVRAATDALTGLPNRRAADDTLKRMVAHASRTLDPLAAILLDLDHFKQINDVYGHERGDEVLAAVGSVLQASVRESDFVARSGGEEFLVLLAATPLEGAETVAEKIRRAIAGIEVPQLQRAISASLGVAVVPDHAADGATLLRLADRALYEAKAKGRNRVVVFDREAPGEPEPSLGENSAGPHEHDVAL